MNADDVRVLVHGKSRASAELRQRIRREAQFEYESGPPPMARRRTAGWFRARSITVFDDKTRPTIECRCESPFIHAGAEWIKTVLAAEVEACEVAEARKILVGKKVTA